MSTFKLDKSIFNPTLYKQVSDIWLAGVDFGGEELSEDALKRWFTGTPEERLAFDGVCRENFAHALEAIGPDKVLEPSAKPFLDEIQSAAEKDKSGNGEEAAWTALSLAILLDQIPRNIYRTNDGLRKVYNHYDRISYDLVHTLLSPYSPISRPDLNPQWRNSAIHRAWFYLPLIHSEDLEAHKFLDEILEGFQRETEKLEGHAVTKMYLQQQIKAEREHREILDRFGRYPHRNGALGRESTEEEDRFLAEGGATFGVVQTKETGRFQDTDR